MYVQHGLELPDTPVMALHRGRIDLLEEHLRRDPGLLRRTFSHREIYPAEMGCKRADRCDGGHAARRARRCFTCAWTTTRSRSRAGCSISGMDVNARAAVGAQRLRRLHGAVQHRRVAAELLDELREARTVRGAIHRAASGTRRRPERARLDLEAAASRPRRHARGTTTAMSRRCRGAGAFTRRSSSANPRCG